MKKIIIFIYFIIFITYIYPQQSNELTINKICNLNGYTKGDVVLENSKSIDENNYLYSYLSEIINTFNLPINSTYKIRRSFDNIAGSLFIRENNAIIPTIVINDNYFLSKIKNKKYRKAIIIFILSHEISHILSDDFREFKKSNIAKNLTNEIFADERAGFVLGKLTKIDTDFFDNVLPLILKGSETHPEPKYRIIAAKTGWSKAKNKPNFDTYISVNNIFIGQKINNKKQGEGIFIKLKENKEIDYIYLGNWKNDYENGQGIYLKYFDCELMYIPGKYQTIKLKNNDTITIETRAATTTAAPKYLKYIGMWENGLPNGYGNFEFYKTDSSYIKEYGKFIKGKRFGVFNGFLKVMTPNIYRTQDEQIDTGNGVIIVKKEVLIEKGKLSAEMKINCNYNNCKIKQFDNTCYKDDKFIF